MNGVTIMIISLAVLLLAYILYGRWIAKKWGVDPKEKPLLMSSVTVWTMSLHPRA